MVFDLTWLTIQRRTTDVQVPLPNSATHAERPSVSRRNVCGSPARVVRFLSECRLTRRIHSVCDVTRAAAVANEAESYRVDGWVGQLAWEPLIRVSIILPCLTLQAEDPIKISTYVAVARRFAVFRCATERETLTTVRITSNCKRSWTSRRLMSRLARVSFTAISPCQPDLCPL